jgi:hypothetical protein
MDIVVITVQIDDRVTYHLAGAMVRDVPAAIRFENTHVSLEQFLIASKQVVIASRFPDRIRMVVFGKDNRIGYLSSNPLTLKKLLQFPGKRVFCSAYVNK